MALTFPVDTKEPIDIDAFRHIFDRYPDDHEEVSKTIKYLCYRFDPKSVDIRKCTSIDEKRRLSEDKSDWKRPDPVASADANGNVTFSGDWQRYSVIEGMFFEIIDDLEFKYLVSLEIAIDNCNAVLRCPIPMDLDEDAKAKAIINIHKAGDANDAALERRRKLMARITDGDEDSLVSIAAAIKTRRKPISPEGMLNGGRK